MLPVGTAQGLKRLQLCTRPFSSRRPRRVPCLAAAAQRRGVEAAPRPQQPAAAGSSLQPASSQLLPSGVSASMALWLLAGDLPAQAAELSGSAPASSYYVSLGLFLITLPGGWVGCGSGERGGEEQGCLFVCGAGACAMAHGEVQ